MFIAHYPYKLLKLTLYIEEMVYLNLIGAGVSNLITPRLRHRLTVKALLFSRLTWLKIIGTMYIEEHPEQKLISLMSV